MASSIQPSLTSLELPLLPLSLILHSLLTLPVPSLLDLQLDSFPSCNLRLPSLLLQILNEVSFLSFILNASSESPFVSKVALSALTFAPRFSPTRKSLPATGLLSIH
jgi:hypothetical protein